MATGLIGGNTSGGGGGGGKSYYTARFTSSGTFTLPSGYGVGNPLYVDAFVVGAGGGAAANLNSTNYTWGGGGGGGGVKRDVIALTADAPIVVGKGGGYGIYVGMIATGSGGNAGNGSFSAVNATAKNLFINPQLLGATGASTVATPWYGSNVTFNFAQAAVSGNIMTLNTNAIAKSQPYRVTPGATYTFSFYGRSTSSSGVQSLINAYFLTSTDRVQTHNSLAQTLTPAMNTTWSRYSLTFTVPAGSDMMLLAIFGGQTVALSTQYSNFQLELNGSVTSYADGDTAGYAWVGSRDGSETVASGTYVAVPGGGGGGHASSSFAVSLGTMCSGFAGATSGGGCSYPQVGANISAASGGHGGGAGGPATPPMLMYTTSGSWGWGPVSPPVPYGAGSNGFSTSALANLVASRGAPGPGIDGYGMGGYGGGMIATNTSNSDTKEAGVPIPNTGMGASGVLISDPQQTNIANGSGNTGADGVVILRYWA